MKVFSYKLPAKPTDSLRTKSNKAHSNVMHQIPSGGFQHDVQTEEPDFSQLSQQIELELHEMNRKKLQGKAFHKMQNSQVYEAIGTNSHELISKDYQKLSQFNNKTISQIASKQKGPFDASIHSSGKDDTF